MKKFLCLILALSSIFVFTLFISVIVAVFAVQNAVSVSLNFAVWTMQTNLVIVILGSACWVLWQPCFLP